ncbi:MAG: hypothetical protein HY203_09590 [Nitrospirae bacterium]|nr:hypothetical protein [Nitrospirota bacterium]
MKFYIHKDCGETAVERPDTVMPELPIGFPFTCISCLGEIEDESDLTTVEMMSQ